MGPRTWVDAVGIWSDVGPEPLWFPWDNVHKAVVYAWTVLPDDELMVTLDVSLINGEYLDLNSTSPGFAEVTESLAKRGGRPLPDIGRMRPDDEFQIYR